MALLLTRGNPFNHSITSFISYSKRRIRALKEAKPLSDQAHRTVPYSEQSLNIGTSIVSHDNKIVRKRIIIRLSQRKILI